MATDRTPEELDEMFADCVRVQKVIDQTVNNYISWVVADQLDEPADVCESWLDRVWDGLRDNLDGEDRLRVILNLLEPQVRERANQLINACEDGRL